MSNSDVVRGKSAFRCAIPIMFHRFADEFLKAAEGFEVTGDFSPVACFLYCKSIELSLKAFLLAKSVPVSRFKGKRGIGHDLERALEEAEVLGLVDIIEIACHYKEELRKANYYYVEKGFEYVDNYELMMKVADFPSLKVLSEFASMLVAKLEKICFESVHTFVERSREGC